MAEIYVGTYAKYNAGNLEGVWLDLEEFDSYEEFMEAARAIHDDELDPELMFQDHSDIPHSMVCESHVDPEVWQMLDEIDYEAACAYVECFGSWSREGFQDRYLGEFDSAQDYVREFLDNTGMLDSLPDWAQGYFDFEAYARDLQLGGEITRHNTYYFRTY
jgi:antirestriction protein